MSTLEVVLTWQADEHDVALLSAGLPERVRLRVPPRVAYEDRHVCCVDDLLDIAEDADVLMGWIIPEEVVEAARSVRLVQPLHAGVDHLDFEQLQRRGILLGNVAGANAVAVAEHAMALLLALAKRVLSNHEAALGSRPLPLWTSGLASMQLAGSTLAVIGLGRIGARIARMARGFDMHVIGVRRDAGRGGADADQVLPPSKLEDALQAADMVALAAPLTNETRGLLGPEQFRALKPDALLVNVSRGELINELALAEALTGGMLAGFAADVWWSYPPATVGTYYRYPSMAGIHLLPNVIVSPDRASNTLETRDAMLRLGADNVAALAAGEPLPHMVDLNAGY
jgi:phosphoglycerate dehydrogenase-like enzyme